MERPAQSTSWKEPMMRKRKKGEYVYAVVITKGRIGFPKGHEMTRVSYKPMAKDIAKRYRKEGVGVRIVRKLEHPHHRRVRFFGTR
jgi:hypothetical protein